MDVVKMEKNEITKEIYKIIESVEKDKNELMTIANKKDFSIDIKESYEIENRIRKAFKFSVLNDFSFNWDSKGKYESLTNTLYYTEKNKEYHFLRLIGFSDISLKNETVTLSTDRLYYLHHLKQTFNIPNIEKDNIKEFKNGKTIIKFKDASTFKAFKDIAFYMNSETDQIIDNITQADLSEYKRLKGLSYGNVYNVVHQIGERINKEKVNPSNWIYPNYYLIFSVLDKRLKETV
jgi:hypothetical protein